LLGTGTVENARQIVPEAIDQYPEVKNIWSHYSCLWCLGQACKRIETKEHYISVKNNDLRPVFICEDGNRY
jgi:hypothetical protein